MSERLYFIFGLPAFEIELKNRKLMVNHKAVKFNGEKLFISSGNDWVNILVSLCFSRSRQDLTEIQKESSFTARSCRSRRDVENLAANSTEI